MKFTAAILALVAVASAGSIEQKSAMTYTYEDIREQELKCKADRNREWKYDAATNTWACPLQRYDWETWWLPRQTQLVNKKIRDSNLPEDIRIGAVLRKDQVIIPRSNFIFEKDDLVVFLAKREELKAVESIFSLGSI